MLKDMTPQEILDQQITWVRERIKVLQRLAHTIERQINIEETRIDDLRRVQDHIRDEGGQ